MLSLSRCLHPYKTDYERIYVILCWSFQLRNIIVVVVILVMVLVCRRCHCHCFFHQHTHSSQQRYININIKLSYSPIPLYSCNSSWNFICLNELSLKWLNHNSIDKRCLISFFSINRKQLILRVSPSTAFFILLLR